MSTEGRAPRPTTQAILPQTTFACDYRIWHKSSQTISMMTAGALNFEIEKLSNHKKHAHNFSFHPLKATNPPKENLHPACLREEGLLRPRDQPGGSRQEVPARPPLKSLVGQWLALELAWSGFLGHGLPQREEIRQGKPASAPAAPCLRLTLHWTWNPNSLARQGPGRWSWAMTSLPHTGWSAALALSSPVRSTRHPNVERLWLRFRPAPSCESQVLQVCSLDPPWKCHSRWLLAGQPDAAPMPCRQLPCWTLRTWPGLRTNKFAKCSLLEKSTIQLLPEKNIHWHKIRGKGQPRVGQRIEPNHAIILTIERHALQVPFDNHTMAGNALPCLSVPQLKSWRQNRQSNLNSWQQKRQKNEEKSQQHKAGEHRSYQL